MYKKLLVFSFLILAGFGFGSTNAASSSSSFMVTSGQVVASGSLGKSSNFSVQTKSLTVGIQGISDSFQIKKTDQEYVVPLEPVAPVVPVLPTNPPIVEPEQPISNQGGSNRSGGKNIIYNPQSIVNGNPTTDKSVRYKSKITEDHKTQDTNNVTEKLQIEVETETITEEIVEKEIIVKPKESFPNTIKITKSNEGNLNKVNTVKEVSTEEAENLSFFKKTQEFTTESQKLLAKNNEPEILYESAPTQPKENKNYCILWIFIAFLIGVIVGASCEHFRFIKTHSTNIWKKIKQIALRIWKI